MEQRPSSKSNFNEKPRYANPIGTFVSLYAGAGGIDIGFVQAGFNPVWVNEIDADALATHDLALTELSKYLPHLRLGHTQVAGDINQADLNTLPKPGSVELVIGGPPCQGFSIAGKMSAEDPRSRHVFKFLDIVEQVAPRAFVMENVANLYRSPKFQSIRESLEQRAKELGYTFTWKPLNAADFGVPQNRERAFFIGIRERGGSSEALSDALDRHLVKQPRVTVREALSELPKDRSGHDECSAKISFAKNPVVRPSLFAGMLFNGAGRLINLDGQAPTLPASMGGNRTPIIDEAWLREPGVTPVLSYYHQGLLSGTIKAKSVVVPAGLRRISVQEAACLQTFPASMTWVGARSKKFRQIGNAVPPKLAYAVALAVREVMLP